MAMDVKAVRAGLQELLDKCLGGAVQIATAPDQITPPCIFIGMPTMTYNGAFQRGLNMASFPVYAILPRVHDQSAVDQADEWISGEGPTSFVEIINSDRSLSGSCQNCTVSNAIPEFWPGATGELPAYNWELEVYA